MEFYFVITYILHMECFGFSARRNRNILMKYFARKLLLACWFLPNDFYLNNTCEVDLSIEMSFIH